MYFLKNRCGSFLSEIEDCVICPDSLLASDTRKLRVKLKLHNNNMGGYYTIFFLSFLPVFFFLFLLQSELVPG